ncbi:hypothetical protein G3M48_001789 [Beauveria asiatica]|uniref:Uncharacterized protein n=1 Tax=Beauveria asiatica TaxID=1069075 RepID=A0AAW0RYV8_9HYPO
MHAIVQLIVFTVLTGRVWSFDTAKDIVTVDQVKSRVADLQRSLSLTVNNANPPWTTADLDNEPVCAGKITSCTTVYFRNMKWLEGVGDVTITAHANVDADLETRHEGGTPQPDKVTTKTSTMLTGTTTKGWKVGLKLSPAKPIASLIGGDISGEYSEQYAEAKATTTERSVEKFCPPNHRCTIQTITYQATLPGNCLSYPMIDCGGGIDPCGTFSKTPIASKYPTSDVMDSFFQPCQQFLDFANKECNRDFKKTEKCEITVPILNASGQPYSHMITTQESLDKAPARRADKGLRVRRQDKAADVGEPPADLVVEFLEDLN